MEPLEAVYNTDLCRLIEKGGVTLAVDKVSLEFVRGATIEYAEDLLSASFRVRPPMLAVVRKRLRHLFL